MAWFEANNDFTLDLLELLHPSEAGGTCLRCGMVGPNRFLRGAIGWAIGFMGRTRVPVGYGDFAKPPFGKLRT